MNQIIIYGTQGCSKCKQLNKICETNNYNKEYVEVTSDELLNELLTQGAKSFPVVKINNDYFYGNTLDEFTTLISNKQ